MKRRLAVAVALIVASAGIPVSQGAIVALKRTAGLDTSGSMDVRFQSAAVTSVTASDSPHGGPAFNPGCDFNGDNAVDVVDLLYMVENWGISA